MLLSGQEHSHQCPAEVLQQSWVAPPLYTPGILLSHLPREKYSQHWHSEPGDTGDHSYSATQRLHLYISNQSPHFFFFEF